MNSELNKAYFINTLEYKEIPEIVKHENDGEETLRASPRRRRKTKTREACEPSGFVRQIVST
jgi:hypothetical protein